MIRSYIDDSGIVHTFDDPIPVRGEVLNIHLGEVEQLSPSDRLLDLLSQREVSIDSLTARVAFLERKLLEAAEFQAQFAADVMRTVEGLNSRLALTESRASAVGGRLFRHIATTQGGL